MHPLSLTLFGYLVGSLPVGYLAARSRGVDLRKAGSGNVGAANAYRTGGLAMALMVMAIDVAKGTGAVMAAERLAGGAGAQMAAGVAAMLGHMYPPWLGFRGGKGVATAAGVFTVLAPLATALAVAAFVLTVWWTRYVSLGSVVGCLVLAIGTALFDAPLPVVIGGAMAVLIIAERHRANLARVMAGTERRLGEKKSEI